MEKQKNTQIIVIAVLAVAILTMSVGFATFTETLNLSVNTTVGASKWSVAYDTTSYVESSGSVTVPVADRTLSGTSIAFAVNLAKPGDFYEFTINVKNGGTFDVNMTGLTMSTLDAAQQKYLTYKITYGGTTYTASANSLTHALAANGTAPVKVRVEYVQPEDSNDLPSEAVTVNLIASLDYEQA